MAEVEGEEARVHNEPGSPSPALPDETRADSGCGPVLESAEEQVFIAFRSAPVTHCSAPVGPVVQSVTSSFLQENNMLNLEGVFKGFCMSLIY